MNFFFTGDETRECSGHNAAGLNTAREILSIGVLGELTAKSDTLSRNTAQHGQAAKVIKYRPKS